MVDIMVVIIMAEIIMLLLIPATGIKLTTTIITGIDPQLCRITELITNMEPGLQIVLLQEHQIEGLPVLPIACQEGHPLAPLQVHLIFRHPHVHLPPSQIVLVHQALLPHLPVLLLHPPIILLVVPGVVEADTVEVVV